MRPIKCSETLRYKQLIQSQTEDLVLINKKKKICHLVDFAIPADNGVKIKENLNLARQLKKMWNMKVTMIPVVVSAQKKRLK